ncbi:hypothetical protein NDU88_005446 [Pleurodeles waltl]|uniref:Uncharacterized protein n=1 Tax=Pleurodeles waltl TaxID=8319 RepID=A0AAV7WX18_PLEWA|nr:hypothetical protein NDU88_005446 [Pleurodeles waltl]
MQGKAGGPPICVQFVSLIAIVSFGLYSILKGISFGFFNWWYILGSACMVAAAFASFRIYEACLQGVDRETATELTRNP